MFCSKCNPSLKLHTHNTYLSTCCSKCYQSLKLLPLLHLLPVAITATTATPATTTTTAAIATYYQNYPKCYPLYDTIKTCASYTYISGSRVGILNHHPPPSLP